MANNTTPAGPLGAASGEAPTPGTADGDGAADVPVRATTPFVMPPPLRYEPATSTDEWLLTYGDMVTLLLTLFVLLVLTASFDKQKFEAKGPDAALRGVFNAVSEFRVTSPYGDQIVPLIAPYEDEQAGDGSDDGSGGGSGGGSGTGVGSGTGKGTGNGTGNGTKAGNGTSSGTGAGNGTGAGTGNGTGNGKKTGNGTGSGTGAGAGSGNGVGTGTGNGSGAASIDSTSGTSLALLRDADLEMIERREEALNDIRTMLVQQKLDLYIKAVSEGDGIRLDIPNSILFEVGNVELRGQGRSVLRALAPVFAKGKYTISVEGHTDSSPIDTLEFASNWELSANRAAKVVRMFVETGIAPNRLEAVGHADTRPLASNDTEDGRSENRRVTVLLRVGSVPQASPFARP